MVAVSSGWLDLKLIVVPQPGGTASAGLFAGAPRAMRDFGLTLLGSDRTADRLGRRLRLLTAIIAKLAQGRLSGCGVASASRGNPCVRPRWALELFATDGGCCRPETPSCHVQHRLSDEAAVQQLPGHGADFGPACLDLNPWLEHAARDQPGKDCQPF